MTKRHVRPSPARAGMQPWAGHEDRYDKMNAGPTGRVASYAETVANAQAANQPRPTGAVRTTPAPDPYKNVRDTFEREGGIGEMWKKLLRTIQGGR